MRFRAKLNPRSSEVVQVSVPAGAVIKMLAQPSRDGGGVAVQISHAITYDEGE